MTVSSRRACRYVLPRALDSAYQLLAARALLPGGFAYGESVLFAVAMGAIMCYHQTQPAAVSSAMNRVLKFLLGS